MKYVALLFLFLSLNTFAQTEKQIFLQTNPAEKYNITYTAGEYTFCFSYEAFLNRMDNNVCEELLISIKTLIDSRLASQSNFELVPGLIVQRNEYQFDLKQLAEEDIIYYLISDGNYILLDASGKTTIQQLTRSYSDKNNQFVFTNTATGESIYKGYRHFRTTGTPSF